MTSKQFWRLVKRTVKKRGILRVVRDAQGRLATDRARIEEIVLEEGSAIFSQRRTAHQRDGRKTANRVARMDERHSRPHNP